MLARLVSKFLLSTEIDILTKTHKLWSNRLHSVLLDQGLLVIQIRILEYNTLFDTFVFQLAQNAK